MHLRAVLVLMSLASAGCGQTSEKPAAPRRAWDFVNADSAEIFSGKMARAVALMTRATRLSPNAGAVGSHAAACLNPTDIFALPSPPPPPSRALGLTGAESCAAAFTK